MVDRAYTATYPGHPEFEPADVEVRVAELKAVHAHLVRAMADPQKRVPLQGDVKGVRRVANALGVGKAAETHFIFGDDRFMPWGSELARATGATGRDTNAPVTVAEVRRWIEQVTPARGLRPEVSDLVVLAWGLLRQRSWWHRGASIEAPDPGKLLPEMELRLQPMPTPSEWAAATTGAAELLGVPASPFLTPQAVATLVTQVRDEAKAHAAPAQKLVGELERAYGRLGLSTGETGRTDDRLVTARRAAAVAQSLQHLQGVEMVRRLGAEVEDGRGSAVGNSLKHAASVVAALEDFRWERLEPLRAADDDAEASQILGRLKNDLTSDEIVARAAEALQRADNDAFQWAVNIRPVTPPPPVQPVQPTAEDDPEVVPLPSDPVGPVSDSYVQRFARGSGDADAVVADLREFLQANAGKQVEVTWRVVE